MKRFISIILAVLLAVSMTTAVFAAEATQAKFNLETLKKELQAMETDYYTNKRIYDSRIKSITNQLIWLNKEIKAKNPPAKTKALHEALKMADTWDFVYDFIRKTAHNPSFAVCEKPGAPKKTDSKNLQETVSLIIEMRREANNAMVYYKFKKEYNTPSVNVTDHYQEGMTRNEVHASINALIGPAYSLGSNGNLLQGDKTTPTNISVHTTSSGFSIYITGWRRSKTDASGMNILEHTREIFNYFWKEAGDAAFLWYDAMMTSGDADPADYGFTDTDPTSSTTTLIYNKTGTRIGFTQGNGHDSLYVE